MHEFYYEKEGDEFLLVERDDNFGRDVIWRGPEVAIGFSFDPSSDRAIQFTTHRHGSPETVEKWANKTRFALNNSRFFGNREHNEQEKDILRGMLPHIITTDQWDVEDLNQIISTTGYLGVVLNKLGISVAG